MLIQTDEMIERQQRSAADYEIKNYRIQKILLFLKEDAEALIQNQVPVEDWESSCKKGNEIALILENDPDYSTKRRIGTGPDAKLAVDRPILEIRCKQEKYVLMTEELSDPVADTFTVKSFSYAQGKKLIYNLFVPRDYDQRKSYPLVIFLHDSGSCSADAAAPLVQGNGGVVWACMREQQKRPCFVVAPVYPEKCAEDDYTVGWEAEATMALLKELMSTYSIDKNRIYGTGQSMGCMILCELNIRYPDFFGGCFLVAGQWDPRRMAAAKHANFWIVVSEKDEKAFPIMGDCVRNMEKSGASVSRGSFSARLPEKVQNEKVQEIAQAGNSVSFVWFEGDSVLPEGDVNVFPGAFHMNTWAKAYQIEAIREWLFKQYRTLDFSAKHEVLIRNEDGSLQPMDQPYFKAVQVAPGTWQILSDGDYSYLVEGEDEAVVIDSGYGSGNIREFCKTLTDRPVKNIINTHDHFDHTANNCYFECAYMSAATKPLATLPFKSFAGIRFPRDYTVQTVKEGDVIRLGSDRCLEVYEIPDHAAGSIALLDAREKILFCGDEMCMPSGKCLNGSVERFKGYLEKLEKRRTDIDRLMGGPGICDAQVMDQLLENMSYILAGHEGRYAEQEKEADIQQKTGQQDNRVIYDRRFPHWPEDRPDEFGRVNPGQRVMEYAGIIVTYNADRVWE